MHLTALCTYLFDYIALLQCNETAYFICAHKTSCIWNGSIRGNSAQFLCIWLFHRISSLCCTVCILCGSHTNYFGLTPSLHAISCQYLDLWIGAIWIWRIFSDKLTNRRCGPITKTHPKNSLRTTMLRTYHDGATNDDDDINETSKNKNWKSSYSMSRDVCALHKCLECAVRGLWVCSEWVTLHELKDVSCVSCVNCIAWVAYCRIMWGAWAA